MLEGLNRGLPRLGIGKSSKVNRMRAEQVQKNGCMCRTKNSGCTHYSCDDVVDKRCLCGGIIKNKVDSTVDLNTTRQLLKTLDL